MTAMIIIITIIIPTLSATLRARARVCVCVCVAYLGACASSRGSENTVSTLARGLLRTLFICMESRHDITSSSFCFS